MKSKLIIIAISFLSITISNAQNRLRVNNTGVNAPYPTLDQALTAAVLGDIILLEHSDIPYTITGNSVTKRVTIYGPGYFLPENDSTQADTRNATIANIRFDNNSDGAVIQGVILGSVEIEEDNITVSRCKITGSIRIGQTTNALNANVNQCFIEGSADVLVNIVNSTNFVLANNLIKNDLITGTRNVQVAAGSGLILNNLFFGLPDNVFKNATVQNNYFEKSEIDVITSTNLTVDHNMSEFSFLNFYSNPSNLVLHPPDTIFCFDINPSPDRRYNLRANYPINPAINAGADGKNIGMFGGATPYVPSGMPPIPSIWFYQSQSTGTQSGGVTVIIKAKSHK